jgi:hypothetical protein
VAERGAGAGLAFVHYLFYHMGQWRASEKINLGAQRRKTPVAPSLTSCPKENLMHVENDQSETPADRTAGATEQLFDTHVKAIGQRLLQLAEKGDPTALRLCMERIMPPLRERPVQFELPPLERPADAVAAIAAITAGLGDGSLSAAEGFELARMVRTCVEILVLAGREEQETARQPTDLPLHEPSVGAAQLRRAA